MYIYTAIEVKKEKQCTYIFTYIHPVTVGRYCFSRCLYLQLLKILCLRCPRCPVLQKVHQRLFSSILSILDCLIAACLSIFPLISLLELLGTTLAGTAVSTVTEKVCACEYMYMYVCIVCSMYEYMHVQYVCICTVHVCMYCMNVCMYEWIFLSGYVYTITCIYPLIYLLAPALLFIYSSMGITHI